MTKERLPAVMESHIRQLAGEKSFERGRSYFRSGAILEPVRQGMELRAYCEGSEYEPYQLRVRLTQNGIGEATCSCPYDWGGLCKHLIALLLTYVHKPAAFRVLAPIEEMLSPRSKEELITIIGEMINREPDLISVIELTAATQSTKPIDVEAYRRQVQQAARRANPRAIEKEFRALRDTAARLAKAGDWLNAGQVYQALLDEAVDHYDDELQMMDEDGDIAIIIDDYAQGVGQCLKESQADSGTRRAWLETLLEAHLTDIKLGGIDFAASSYDMILEQATKEEWAWIENDVRAEITKRSGWAREALVGFLAEGQERRGETDAAATLIRELGTPEQRVFLLVGEEQFDEAVALARRHFIQLPGLMIQLANALVEAGSKEAAVALITEQASKKDPHWGYAEWLVEHYRKHRNPQSALQWQQKIFAQHPSVEAFKLLHEVSGKLGQWEQVRAEALGLLERGKKTDLLLEIALHEGDAARALELLPRTARGWRYTSQVAEAAEKDHPQEALRLQKEIAERIIEGRQRSAYQQAAQHLKRVKALHERLNTRPEWDEYIQALRTKHTRLRALQEELRKARL